MLSSNHVQDPSEIYNTSIGRTEDLVRITTAIPSVFDEMESLFGTGSDHHAACTVVSNDGTTKCGLSSSQDDGSVTLSPIQSSGSPVNNETLKTSRATCNSLTIEMLFQEEMNKKLEIEALTAGSDCDESTVVTNPSRASRAERRASTSQSRRTSFSRRRRSVDASSSGTERLPEPRHSSPRMSPTRRGRRRQRTWLEDLSRETTNCRSTECHRNTTGSGHERHSPSHALDFQKSKPSAIDSESLWEHVKDAIQTRGQQMQKQHRRLSNVETGNNMIQSKRRRNKAYYDRQQVRQGTNDDESLQQECSTKRRLQQDRSKRRISVSPSTSRSRNKTKLKDHNRGKGSRREHSRSSSRSSRHRREPSAIHNSPRRSISRTRGRVHKKEEKLQDNEERHHEDSRTMFLKKSWSNSSSHLTTPVLNVSNADQPNKPKLFKSLSQGNAIAREQVENAIFSLHDQTTPKVKGSSNLWSSTNDASQRNKSLLGQESGVSLSSSTTIEREALSIETQETNIVSTRSKMKHEQGTASSLSGLSRRSTSKSRSKEKTKTEISAYINATRKTYPRNDEVAITGDGIGDMHAGETPSFLSAVETHDQGMLDPNISQRQEHKGSLAAPSWTGVEIKAEDKFATMLKEMVHKEKGEHTEQVLLLNSFSDKTKSPKKRRFKIFPSTSLGASRPTANINNQSPTSGAPILSKIWKLKKLKSKVTKESSPQAFGASGQVEKVENGRYDGVNPMAVKLPASLPLSTQNSQTFPFDDKLVSVLEPTKDAIDSLRPKESTSFNELIQAQSPTPSPNSPLTVARHAAVQGNHCVSTPRQSYRRKIQRELLENSLKRPERRRLDVPLGQDVMSNPSLDDSQEKHDNEDGGDDCVDDAEATGTDQKQVVTIHDHSHGNTSKQEGVSKVERGASSLKELTESSWIVF